MCYTLLVSDGADTRRGDPAVNEYGSDIRAERSRRRLTQEQVVRRRGIFRPTLVDIEQGRIEISEAEYKRFLDAIDQDETAT